MARDFMQDILPKDEPPRLPRKLAVAGDEVEVPSDRESQVPERSIRNINVTRTRSSERPFERPSQDRREVPPIGGGVPRTKRSRGSLWLWLFAGALLLALVGVALFMFRSTVITVTPRAHTVVFDSSKTFTAYPSTLAPAGALTYASQEFDLDDTQSVTSQGTSHIERKSSGTVTVVNEFSVEPVKLVKSTRFQSPDGLIFRVPIDVSVPGMKSGAAGTITVTLVADMAGTKYNISPVSRFTLPGLKGGQMFEKVYARSSATFTGGFSGDEPAVAANTRAAAVSEMQGRLKTKVQQQIASLVPNDGTIFPSFAVITFEEMPATAGTAQGQVTLNERAHVEIPVLPTQELNKQIAGAVSSEIQNTTLTLTPKEGFGATLLNATSTAIGSSPIRFTLTGTAQLVWGVDSNALVQTLAGKDQSAFQTVVNGFPGVQEARARIEPFWQHTFPVDPKDIQVVMAEPREASGQ